MGCVKYLYMKVSKNLTIGIAKGYISCTNIAQTITLHQKNKLNMKKLYLTLPYAPLLLRIGFHLFQHKHYPFYCSQQGYAP